MVLDIKEIPVQREKVPSGHSPCCSLDYFPNAGILTFHDQSSPGGNHIVFSVSWQRARLGSMGWDVTKPVAVTMAASATRPVGSVRAWQAGPGPTAQKVSLRSQEK